MEAELRQMMDEDKDRTRGAELVAQMQDVYKRQKLTCAEAMFMDCNEYYHLNLSEETRKMFSVMGLGMQLSLIHI